MEKKSLLLAALGLLSVVSIAALVLGIVAVVQVNKTTEDESTTTTEAATTATEGTTATAPVVVADFPADFEFGSATSSYQIEGGWNADGKSPSIWDTATHNHPDIIKDKSNGDEAADSYNRYKEDVQALKETGFNYYRFSIAWTRILPDGRTPNQAGLQYYSNLINELLSNGIKPMITMYHWDLPQYLQDIGGWTNNLIVDHFDQYSDLIFKTYGDRVKTFITFNEPYIFCQHGYGNGQDAPLVKSEGLGVYLCGRNVLLSHAKAYRNYQAKYKSTQNGKVGICINTDFFYPYQNTSASLADQALNHMFGWFTHPIFSKTGNYPQIMIDNIKRNSEPLPWSRLPELSPSEIDDIKGSADFLAINYYSSRLVKPKENYPEEYDWEADAGIDRLINPDWSRGESSWLYSVPEGLHDLLVWIKNSFDNPTVIIAENGFSDTGNIEDDDRIKYIKDHLTSVKRAIDEGCNVVAYTVWSLLDNFEWLAGYTERFGIYYIDFHSKKRIPKKSSKYFKELITSRKI